MKGENMTVAYDFVLELKKAVKDFSGVYLHFHDGCGGQYFELEDTSEELRKFIADYLGEKNIGVDFREDNLIFTLK